MARKKEEKEEKPFKPTIGYIKQRKLEDEMIESYLDYAMSVIISRALPDVRDGLKPVHRRILYAMNNLGLRSNAKYRKSATIVGEVIGKYHPHGDMAVYDSMVRMAQDFSLRYPLIDGQGNFGSMDGDAAAAYRYTEARLSKFSEEILTDIDKDTVDWMDNFDGTLKEPKVLPAKLPNLLLNGSMGIAVGMATNIPPHNLSEVADAIIHLIDNPDASVDDLMQFIKGPDFPTGGNIYNIEDIKMAYATGKGRIIMRGTATIEETKKGFQIIITEIPFGVNKADLVSKIAELVKEKKIEGVSDLRDESDREGVRIVIELRQNAFPKKILNRLYTSTPLQSSFGVNMVALIDGLVPRVLTLKNILEHYIEHRKVIVTRRTKFELERARERVHILEGLMIALKHLDAVINTIKKSKNKEEAHKNLMKKFKLTNIQAQAILDMRLSALAALERQKVEDEYKEKKKLIALLESILKSPKKILGLIKDELTELKQKYGDERRTKVFKTAIGKFTEEDLIPNEQVIVTLTRSGYIKRMPINIYRAQGRGGKGIMGIATKEEDIVEHLLVAYTHDDMLFFTNKGRVFQAKVYEVPAASRTAKGQSIVNLLQIAPDEMITAVVGLGKQLRKEFKYLFMTTKLGKVKKTELTQFENVRRSGLIAIRLQNGDELKWVKPTTGSDDIMIVTANGQAIRFNEKGTRPMGRAAAGVRGISLRKDDEVVGMDIVLKGEDKGRDVLIVMENGYGKRTKISLYKRQGRGGIGLVTAKITPKTGKICSMQIVLGEELDVVMISKSGQIIRLPIRSINRLSRPTQGVILMRLNPGDKVASVTVLEKGGEGK